jgi:RNA polymerase sigma factor (sigma-70 family)
VLYRLLKNLPASAWDQVMTQETEERREFVRAIDAVKKRFQRNRWQSAVAPEFLADARDTENRSRNEERDAMDEAARRVLTSRQQRILQLICAGANVSEIAQELSMTPERVSDEKYKAIQKLRAHFGV